MSQLAMVRGDTNEVIASVTSGLDEFGINGWSFWFTAKYDYNDSDAVAAIKKLPGDFSISVAGDANTTGVAFAIVSPADTANLPGHTTLLWYDLQAKDSNGNIYTLDSGQLIVSPDVTRATS